jgi:hypothetical protein
MRRSPVATGMTWCAEMMVRAPIAVWSPISIISG